MEDNEHSIEFNDSNFDNKEFDNKLRPISFSDFSGQDEGGTGQHPRWVLCFISPLTLSQCPNP